MPPEEKPDTLAEALGAMNEALGEEHGGTAPKADDAPAGDTDADADADAEGGDSDADPDAEPSDKSDGEGEDGTGEGEGEDEGGEPDANRPRNADGTFKSKEQLAKEGLNEKGQPLKPGEKKPDALNDPIPKDLKQETQERIRTLITTAREATKKVEEVEKNFNYLVQGVQQTGTTPEQYGEVLSWMGLFNSGDKAQQEKALELVEGVADRLATHLGKERKVGDPLSAHPDLIEAVKTGKVTSEYAKEIARTRNAQQLHTSVSDAASKQQQEAAAFTQAKETARNDLNTLEQSLRATDPQYERKKGILTQALGPIFKDMHPSQWKAKFEAAYKALPNVNAQRAAPKLPAKGQQPMRPGRNNAQGGKQGEAKTALEAMNLALGGQ